MKLLLALSVAVCFAAVYSDKDNEVKAMVLECAKEAKVDIKVLDETHGADFVPTREMTCFSACLLKKQKLMDASGKYTENFKADKDISSVCKDAPEYGSDACETAGKLIMCLKQHGSLEKIKTDLGKSTST